jgi:hypothetical protein
MSKNILEDTTVEIVVDLDNDDDVPAANLANVEAVEPVITTIDLVSETSSESRVEILEEVTSTTAPGQTPGQVYDTWTQGLASTSTPTTSVLSITRARREERQIEQLRSLVQENQEFNNLFDQPDSTWPANLDESALKNAYARAYAVAENEFPELLAGDKDLPHPSEFKSESEGPESGEDDVAAVTNIGSTTANVTEVTSETPEGPVGSDVIGPILCDHGSPVWPPPPLWQSIRPGPIPSPSTGFSPIPSTSTGRTRPAKIPSWYGSKYGLIPMNQKARQLWSEGFTTEEAIHKVLNEKTETSGEESTKKIAETFNDYLRTQINRRARILEVVKNQQARYEYYLNHGMRLPNPNPGHPYRGKGVPEEIWDGELEVSVEPKPEEPSMLSSDPSEPGKCSPNNCICPDGEKCAFWENANYT